MTCRQCVFQNVILKCGDGQLIALMEGEDSLHTEILGSLLSCRAAFQKLPVHTFWHYK